MHTSCRKVSARAQACENLVAILFMNPRDLMEVEEANNMSVVRIS